jgi:hypothetical protein
MSLSKVDRLKAELDKYVITVLILNIVIYVIL